MTDLNSSEPGNLSLRCRPKVSGFMPILKTVDGLNNAAAQIDVGMAMGENWLTREPLIAICKKVMVEGLGAQDLSYSHGMGGPAPLLSASASYFNHCFKPSMPIKPEHVITTAGASTCLYALMYAICDEGDSVIVPSPFWGGCICFTKIRSDVNVITTKSLPFRSAVSMDVVAAVRDAYVSAAEPKRMKALPSVLRELMAFCKNKRLHYIPDEVLAMSTFPREGEENFTSALSLVDDDANSPMDPDRLHIIYSMSKDFESASLRMSPELPSIVKDAKVQLARNYSMLSLTFDKWGIEHIPAQADFHLFAKVARDARTWEEEGAVVQQLSEVGVMTAPGKGYGGIDCQIGWIRMSFCIPEVDLKEGLRRIGNTLGLERDGQT